MGSRDVGCLFAAITGQGAFVGPLRGDSAGERAAHPDIVAQRALRAAAASTGKSTLWGFTGGAADSSLLHVAVKGQGDPLLAP